MSGKKLALASIISILLFVLYFTTDQLRNTIKKEVQRAKQEREQAKKAEQEAKLEQEKLAKAEKEKKEKAKAKKKNNKPSAKSKNHNTSTITGKQGFVKGKNEDLNI
jgi:predicted Holliday junction resolvase-like endonuclease